MGQTRKGSKNIPDKLYFKIGEVSEIVGVDPHVLRYWESEFSIIKPYRTNSRQRLYRREDIENLIRISELLYDQGFTIAGARQALNEEKKGGSRGGCESSAKLVSTLKKELLDLKRFLDR